MSEPKIERQYVKNSGKLASVSDRVDLRQTSLLSHPQGFVPERTTNFQQHQRRIEQLIIEGMHDGKGWKPEAFPRYNELELSEHAPSSPAAPTPHTNAAEQFEKWVDKAYPNMDYDSGEEIAVKFAEAYAASETARADRMEQERDKAHALGMQSHSEWLLFLDAKDGLTPEIIAEKYTRWFNAQPQLQTAEADLQRKDAALRVALEWAANYPLKGFGSEEDGRAARQTYDVIEAALAPISVPAAPEVTTPSPCCANPNLKEKRVCIRVKGECHWTHTHNVCLNCGKEEAL